VPDTAPTGEQRNTKGAEHRAAHGLDALGAATIVKALA
jgi:hypothetical protein